MNAASAKTDSAKADRAKADGSKADGSKADSHEAIMQIAIKHGLVRDDRDNLSVIEKGHTSDASAVTKSRASSAATMTKTRAVSAAMLALATLIGVGCAANPSSSSLSIGEALTVPDDTKVVVTGEVVQQIDEDHYLLRDSTGSITAEIDEHILGEIKIAPNARMRVGGVVDQDHKPAILEAKTVQLL